MTEPSDLDRSAVRRQFDRRLAQPDPADFVFREVEHRMFERLDLVRLSPSRVLDIGCGTGQGTRQLRARWPAAEVVGVDFSLPRLQQAAAAERPDGSSRAGTWIQGMTRRLLGRQQAPVLEGLCLQVAADAHQLPLADACADLIWSNLAMHWFDDVPTAFAEWYRVVRPDGLLMFSALGVDSLIELRAAGAGLPVFPDMHDVGDALVAAGFSEPVMDTERFTVTWRDARRMLTELRGLGGNALRSRPPGLSTPRQFAAAIEQLERLATPPGAQPAAALSVSFEIIFGHAWCAPRKRRTDGYMPIEFRPSGRSPSKA